jgi:Phosphorylase superfamily
MSSPVKVIFVPQGAEFNAVQRGLRRSGGQDAVKLYAIPMGPQPIRQFLQQWQQTEFKTLAHPSSFLLAGLCGSLTKDLSVGDRVLYQGCIDGSAPQSVPSLECDAALLQTLQDCLAPSARTVTGLTCDRMVHLAAEKGTLAQRYGAETVDMEGYTFLQALQSLHGIALGILRVVSDDAQHDVPDLAAAIAETGELKPFALASSMIRQPRNALRLIRGSLLGLKQLEATIAELFRKP